MQPPFSVSFAYPQAGEVLDGKYRVERVLGEGGMGAVAKATHLLRRAPVALKFISGAVLSMPGAIERFVNEGVAASQIDSDHVVKVFDVGRLPSGAPYLVMEFLDGFDLGQLLEREGPTMPVPRAVHFTVQVLRALQTAHAAGIVHRDMKPSNVFVVERDGERDFVKLVDFGISKVRAADDGKSGQLTRTNSALGTPLYMSPEQARSPRDVDHRTDLYSTGAILYEMLAGRTPYTCESGEFTEILFKIFTTEPEPITNLRPDLPEGLAGVVHRALAREREGRFDSAADMAEALAPFADERTATVLARVRSGRRSQLPNTPSLLPSLSPPQHSLTPVDESSRVNQSEATARTFATTQPPPRPPSTEVGVAREATPTPPREKSGRNGIALGIVAAAAVAVGGAMFVRAQGRHVEAPADSAARAAVAPPPAVPVPPPAPAAPIAPANTTVVLAPEPSAAPAPPPAAPSARLAPTSRPLPPHPSATAAPPPGPGPAPLPTELGDLKLH